MKVDDLCQPSMVYRHPKPPQTCLKGVQDTLTMKKLTSEQCARLLGQRAFGKPGSCSLHGMTAAQQTSAHAQGCSSR